MRECATSTVNTVGLVAVPDGVESVILPVVAPAGTTAVTFTLVTNVNAAAVPVELHGVHPREVRPVDGHGGPDVAAGRIEARYSWEPCP